jgi:hypothetical protein
LHPGWLAGLKTAENGAVFLGALLKGKELHVLKPLNLSGFGFPSLKHPLCFDFIVAHEGIETNSRVLSLARKLKILRWLRLFRLVVTGLGWLEVSGCKHGAPILSRDHSGEPP